MKNIRFALLAAILAATGPLFAQHQEIAEKPNLWQEKQQPTYDSTSLLHAFKDGKFNGHFRYFFMATDNAAGLTDYYANALGGGIKYETGPFKGFRFGVSGFFIYNIGSSDLSKADEKTGQMNRYETGLFDIEDPANKTDINRLEELYLKYSWKSGQVTLGKQLINTPFINLQDGRMRPTETEGIWAEIRSLKNTTIETGFLYGMSPRSTVRWFSTGESIGVYPTGLNPDGTKSGYAGNITSKGIGVLGVTHQLNQQLSLQIWDVWVHNVFNTAMIQANYTHKLGNKSKLVAGAQYIFQAAVKDGGNEDPSKTYFPKNGIAQTFGAKIGWENTRWQGSLNYNRITADGRYLMPREWGRDPFFTFLPRERNEGFGDVHAIVAKAGYNIPKAGLKTSLGIGYFDLPEVTNYALNKYGLPSYAQVNADIRYSFKGLLKGLEAQLLYVYKHNAGNTFNNDKYVFNKVDMSNWNIVFNFHF